MGEFELIQRYFAKHRTHLAVIGIGDDAAVLEPLPKGQQQVVCLDTLVTGRHFYDGADAADVGWKSLAVNLSDLAAMGATPRWFQLGLTLPDADASWLAGFAKGLFECAEQYGVALIGGDTTRGPLSITVQAAGSVPAGMALLRSGAAVGDELYVSGTLGGAALALLHAEADQQPLNRPQPRMALGGALLGKATSAIDISDGLLADCSHVLEQSGVGATLRLGNVPLAPGIDESQLELALAGGDDYELLVTLPPNSDIATLEKIGQCALTRIGTIEAEVGLRCVSADGAPYNPGKRGWQHFGNSQ